MAHVYGADLCCAYRHWRQLMLNPKGVKIWRPRQLYVGEGVRDYVELEGRKEVDPTPANAPTEVSYLNKRPRLVTSWDPS